MKPRTGLEISAVVAAAVALVLAMAPINWFQDLLEVSSDDAAAFLVRRYAASATAALFVVAASIARDISPQRAALLALATWLGVQGAVAAWGIVSGTVGGLAWLALFTDPLIAAMLVGLSRRVDRTD